MNIFQKLWFYIAQAATYVYLRLGLYAGWSKLYRAVFERRYRRTPVATYPTFRTLEWALCRLVWTGDTWRQLWDAISYPGRVQTLISTGRVEQGIDCDEFGHYISVALTKSLKEGVFKDNYSYGPLQKAQMLTVTWRGPGGKYGGHNVAILTFEENATEGCYRYMDYGMPSWPLRATVSRLVQDVLDDYAPSGTLLAWAIHDENLKVIDAGTK